jgi:hypothetical protein
MITLAVGIFLLYCLIIALIYGVQKSISDSFYTTQQRYYFTAMMLTASFILMIGAGENLWFMFGGFFIGLVGVAPNFKWKVWIVEYLHGGGVFASIICYLIGFSLISLWLGLSALFIILAAVYLLRKVNNSTWWQEIAIILIIYIYLTLI